MPLQNRVTPFGDLVAAPERGLVYGNRGCLHDGAGRIRRRHATRRWIACRLEFRGWNRSPLMQPGRFTELFFLDEATAFAAGHRPCALCRRADYDRLVAVWRELHPGDGGADAIDARLHAERLCCAVGGLGSCRCCMVRRTSTAAGRGARERSARRNRAAVPTGCRLSTPDQHSGRDSRRADGSPASPPSRS